MIAHFISEIKIYKKMRKLNVPFKHIWPSDLLILFLGFFESLCFCLHFFASATLLEILASLLSS
jgi:hypothetical protein